MRIVKLEQSQFAIPHELTISGKKVPIPPELLNQVYTNMRLTCHILDVLPCEVNAIRRIAKGELKTKALILATMETTDGSLNFDDIAIRARCIPINQHTDYTGKTITLSDENTNLEKSKYVSTELFMVDGKKPVSATPLCNIMNLLTLAPRTKIKLSFRVESYSRHGAHSASHCTSYTPLAPDPRDEDGIITIPISEMNQQREFEFFLETNGHITPHAVLTQTLKELSRRFLAITQMLEDNSHETANKEIHITLPGESATTCEIIYNYLFDNNLDEINTVTYNPTQTEKIILKCVPAASIDKARVLQIIDSACRVLADKYSKVTVPTTK